MLASTKISSKNNLFCSSFTANFTLYFDYTYNAKEKDYETGFHYYGSRYYSSELSIWNSTDPMADKYPSLTPYNYCANNPIKLIDPNGEEIDPATETQHIKNLRNPNHRDYNEQFAEACNKLEADKNTLYRFNKESKSWKTDNRKIFGNVSYKGEKENGLDVIYINYTEGLYKKENSLRTPYDFVMFEEVLHCVQFIDGDWGFGYSHEDGQWYGTLGLDLTDEVNAKNQAASALKINADFTIDDIKKDYKFIETKTKAQSAADVYNPNNTNNIKYNNSDRASNPNYLFNKPKK